MTDKVRALLSQAWALATSTSIADKINAVLSQAWAQATTAIPQLEEYWPQALAVLGVTLVLYYALFCIRLENKSTKTRMYTDADIVEGRRVLQNGAIGGYVMIDGKDKPQWRIIVGPRKRPIDVIFERLGVASALRSRKPGAKARAKARAQERKNAREAKNRAKEERVREKAELRERLAVANKWRVVAEDGAVVREAPSHSAAKREGAMKKGTYVKEWASVESGSQKWIQHGQDRWSIVTYADGTEVLRAVRKRQPTKSTPAKSSSSRRGSKRKARKTPATRQKKTPANRRKSPARKRSRR